MRSNPFKRNLIVFLLALMGIISVNKSTAQTALIDTRVDLNGKWELFYGEQDKSAPSNPDELQKSLLKKIEARVPGNVELDMMKANILPDLELGTNVFEARKYETYQWWYKKVINLSELSSEKRTFLVFDGIDCIASIWLNGHLIGNADNMFIQHRFDVTDVLKKGENSLFVQIRSAVIEARKGEIVAFQRSFDSNWESLSIRKAAHMYGWDIMPRLVSAGIWRDVYLEIIPNTQFRSVYWVTRQTDPEKKTAKLFTTWDFETDIPNLDGCNLLVQVSSSNEIIVNEEFPVLSNHGSRNFDVKNVEFWWPKGYGNQPLYEAVLTLKDKNGKTICSSQDKIGVRTLVLDHTNITTKKKPGKFQFVVNGVPVFVRGTNWVPLDAIHSRDKQHLPKMFEMLNDLNCNMVRCWGGNVYEDTDFYDLCDENGIMVWQDFAMGCARYPQDINFQKRLKKEAVSVIRKFRNHASLALWCGDNEDDVSRIWDGLTQHDPNDDVLTRIVLKSAIRDNDPFRSYLPSSPYVSPEVFAAGFDESLMPEVHLWGPRGYYKAPFYTNTDANFVSEIGYHGCPDKASLKRMMEPGSVVPDFENRVWNEQWLAKATMARPPKFTDFGLKRNDLMVNQVEALFGKCPDSFDDFIFASQATQGEAKKFFIDFWRSSKPQKMGIIWWNLRDGWPILSDAIVDYYFNKKIAYDYIKSVQNDVQAIVCEVNNGEHDVVITNDTRNSEKGEITVKNIDSNKILFRGNYTCPENGKVVIGKIPATTNHEMWQIEWSTNTEKKLSTHYLNGVAPFNLDQYRKWFDKLGYKFE